MDTKQIEYILKIAEENNITRAAEKVFITQSALNQQLLKLEKELGTPLFHRSRTNWRLTEAGEIYVKNAKEMLRIKRETYNRISDLAVVKRGRLSVGFTPGRGINLFTSIYPEFHNRYPEIVVEPKERSVRELQDMIADGRVDIGFLTLRDEDRTNDCYMDILEEEIVAAVPAGHPLGERAAPKGEPLAVIDLNELRYEPFVLMQRESTMRTLTDSIFAKAGFQPNVLFCTRDNHTITTMVRSNLCCGIVPWYYAQSDSEGIAYFALPERPTWKVAASYRRGVYLTSAAKSFIELAKKHWTQSCSESDAKRL